MAFGIPRIDDDVHKREPIPGKLFNGLQTQAGRPLTGHCRRRGKAVLLE